MGIPSSARAAGTPPAGDLANYVVTGSFVATGVSAIAQLYGVFNVAVYGSSGPNGAWVGSVQLERSFDGGTTWIVCGIGGTGTQAVWTSTSSGDVSVLVGECEEGVLYRLHCTAWTSGTINYRFSTSGLAAMSFGASVA